MIKKCIFVLAVLIAMSGTALAVADIAIKPDSGPNVDANGVIKVPIDVDAATSIGLGVDYTGFVAGNWYSQSITYAGAVVAGTSSTGGLPTGTDFIPISWTPTSSDIGKTFDINAEATTVTGARVKKITVTAPGEPIPELSTTILTATGILGLLGLVTFRRRT